MNRAPYGSWASPISAAQLAQASVVLSDLRVVDGRPYWTESRPLEGGRHVIVTVSRRGGIQELTPRGFSSRTRVHEYGGASFTATRAALYFANFRDQRLYVQSAGSSPAPLTPEGFRYADFSVHPSGEWIYAVREDHTAQGEPRNAIVALRIGSGDGGTVLFGDSDFVASPRLSPDGRRLAWIAWNHPDMPWDTTTLFVGDIAGDRLTGVRAVAGGRDESVIEPVWDVDGSLFFVSDRSDWWNLYRWTGNAARPVAPMSAEIGSPLWVLGTSSYALTGDGRAVVRYVTNGTDRLGVIDLRSGELRPFDLPYVSMSYVQLLSRDRAILIAATPLDEDAVVTVDLKTGAHAALRTDIETRRSAAITSVAQPIEYPTSDGATAHAFFYPPHNPSFEGPPGEKPPLLVKVHGGPTSSSKCSYDVRLQYWTSRGFAVVDVNHRGSTGFGRKYRHSLYGRWGIVDLEDVVHAVRHLAGSGRIDPKRTAIRGGSAGGFTTLAALAFTDTFRAGANYYGVSDLLTLARDTHKFESRYLDKLVAPLPEGESTYHARSPINHLERFEAALITFQGSEDRVVPPEQSRRIVAALRERGVPVAYLEFEGEQHGFRRAENIIRAAEAELSFYGQVFGFEPADAIEPVEIANLR